MRSLYRTQFSIAPGGEFEFPRRESVPAACVRWALGRHGVPLKERLSELTSNPLQTIPCTESETGERIEAIYVASPPVEWAMRFSHLDSEDSAIRWTVEVALREQDDGALNLACEVFVSRLGDVIAPIFRDPARPRLLAELFEAFPCRSGHLLSARPRVLAADGIEGFLDLLRSPSRKLPVLIISLTNGEGKPLVDPSRLANRAAGLAHFYEHSGRLVSNLLEQVGGLPHRLNAWDGAARIYWPGYSDDDDQSRHFVFAPAHLNELSPVKRIAVITRSLALAAVAQHDPQSPSWRKVERRERSLRIDVLREQGGDLDELLEEYDMENKELRGNVEGLQEELAETRAHLFQAQNEAQSWRLATEALQRGEQPVADLPSPESLEEAVAHATEAYRGELVFALNSASSVVGSPFERPGEALAALRFLATTYRDAKLGERPPKELDIILREECGWTYRSSQSPITMSRFAKDYKAEFNGQEFDLGAHLATRSAKDSRYSLRIGFAWDDRSNKVVVGYVGQHQRTTAS